MVGIRGNNFHLSFFAYLLLNESIKMSQSESQIRVVYKDAWGYRRRDTGESVEKGGSYDKIV